MRPSTRRKASKRNGGRQIVRGDSQAIPHPIQVDITIDHRRRLQFQVVPIGGSTYNTLAVTPYLLCCHIIVAYSTTLGATLFGQVKLHGVKIWYAALQTMGGSTSQSYAPYILWSNSNQPDTSSNSKLITDVSVGMQPMYVHSKTPKESNARLWQIQQDTGKLFEIGCAPGGVIEIDVSYRLQAGVANGLGQALTGATVGKVYFRGLDALPPATSLFPAAVPIGLQI